MNSKKSNEEAEKSFRAQSQVNFVHTKQTDGDFIVYSTENKVAFFDLSKSPIKDKNLCNNLPFKCEGLCTTDSYLLVYGKYNCAISLKDNPFSDTFLEVKGFDGRIKKVETIDDEYFGVSTNIGLYIFNKNENLTTFCFGIVWKGDFESRDVVFDSESKTVFVLSTRGQIVKYPVMDNVAIFSDTMDILIESRAVSISCG